jgi:Ca2+/Na+ antiporter
MKELNTKSYFNQYGTFLFYSLVIVGIMIYARMTRISLVDVDLDTVIMLMALFVFADALKPLIRKNKRVNAFISAVIFIVLLVFIFVFLFIKRPDVMT